MSRDAIEWLRTRLQMALTRGKIVKADASGSRTMAQLDGLAGETKAKIEVMNHFGFSFFPEAGAEVVLLQLGASRSHMVALFADDPALRIGDLQPGEFGWRDKNGQQTVFRGDRIEITTPDGKNIVVICGGDLTVDVTGDLAATVDGDASLDVSGDLAVTVGGDADMIVTGAVTASATLWNITGPMNLTGNIHVTGNIAATGSIEEHQ